MAMRGGSEGSEEELMYVNNIDQKNIFHNNNNNNKVMTDDQLEMLRRQISAYATICDQLVQMHRSITSQHEHLAGMKLGNIYCDPSLTSSGHKIAARQRWTPTSTQLQILERIFDQGNGTPGKQKVKEIANDLSQHGPISETNVYNWFQNRRARSKRKQSTGAQNTVESEAEGEVDSPKEKKSKAENSDISAKKGDNINVRSLELRDDIYCSGTELIKGDSMFEIDRGLRYSEGFDHVAMFESAPRMDYLLDKGEAPEGLTDFQLREEFRH